MPSQVLLIGCNLCCKRMLSETSLFSVMHCGQLDIPAVLCCSCNCKHLRSITDFCFLLNTSFHLLVGGDVRIDTVSCLAVDNFNFFTALCLTFKL